MYNEFEHLTQYSIEDWVDYEDDEDISIALARTEFLSDKPNSHKHIYSIDVIKEYADSYLGKFVVAEYDDYLQDTTTHTDNQKIVGYIPTNQEVQYEQKEDGYWYASVEVAFSKIYAPEVYNLFKADNYRHVSVEQLVGFAPEDENKKDGVEEKHVIGFEGVGITILGKHVNPSVPDANIQMIRMSEDSIQKVEEEYAKYSKKSSNVAVQDKLDNLVAKLENITNYLDKMDKEEVMYAKDENATPEVLEATEQEVMEEAKEEILSESETAETETLEEKEVEECAEEKEVEETEEKTDIKDEDNDEVDKKADEEIAGLAEVTEQLAKAEEKIKQYEAEIAELSEFKKNVEENDKKKVIAETMAQIKDFVDENTYADFKQSGEQCVYADITSWKNEVLASIATKALTKMSEQLSSEEGILDIGMPKETEVKHSIYD